MIKPFVAVLCVVLPALLPGCSEQPAPLRRPQGLLPGEEVARPTTGRLVPPPAAPAPAPPPPSSLPSPFAPRAPDPGALARPQPVALADDAGVGEVAATPPPEAPTETPRDLPSELISLLGQAGSCLDLAAVATAGGRTTISITVSVMPSGRIIRASASAPNQSAEALRCLEQRASSGNFRAPVPAAPREVTATIPIEVVAQPEAR